MQEVSNPYRNLVISAIKQESQGVKTFTLTDATGDNFPYTAGQFITFILNHHSKEERRSFSISSSPEAGEPLCITVKRVDNGVYSRFLHDKASVGDTLQTTGAAGLFVLPGDIAQYKQVFFFAAGIGITPIFSIIKTLLLTQPQIDVVLIYSNTAESDTVFKHELNAWSNKYASHFRIEYLYSTSFNLSRARLSKELLPKLVKEYQRVPVDQMLCYTCGPYAYMRMVTYSLEEMGIRGGQIRKENFNTESKPVINSEPPEKEMHRVTILHNGDSHEISCQYPQTILQAARQNHIKIPYSCETGRCGSCAAICKSGQVWLSYNEVLTDLDLQHGSILTCTGYPVGGDVAIEV